MDSSYVMVEEKLTESRVHASNDASYTPGSSTSYAHDWSYQGTGGELRIHGRHFVDKYGRVCDLRGVNVSGACKTPSNLDHKTFPAKHQEVTFVGRPFPLEEAEEHFARLRRWGLTFIRFLVTWEAVEHEGIGIYDMEYINYLRAILAMLPKFGMTAFVSLHQDVWSRYSGGSGAPAWTLEAVGFDLHALEDSGAAWLLGVKGGGHTEEERGIWPCGYQKLSAATMSTCFWAGDTFAPKLLIKTKTGAQVPIQQYLQNAFLDMFEVIAKSVGDLDGVLGFEIMNEPHRGYVELASMHAWDYNTDLHLAHVPTALQSFTLGAGYPTEVAHWTRSFPFPTTSSSKSVINPHGRKVWVADGPSNGKCIWEMHGVWGYDADKEKGIVLRENYFVQHPDTGAKIDWYTDFYFPFVAKWSERVRNVSSPNKLVFVEPIPNEFCPKSWTPERRVPNLVYSPHWYDLNGLFLKAFSDFSVNVQGLSRGMFVLKGLYWGQEGSRDNFSLQIRNIVEEGYKSIGEIPCMIGECGIPMDLNKKQAFDDDNFTWQARMMDAMITGLEQSLVSFTLWNYNPDNDDRTGDEWNGENFSWFSRRRALPRSLLYLKQDAPSLDNGGRILNAVVRPYPAKTAGIPLEFKYEMNTGEFTYAWSNPIDGPSTSAPSTSVNNPPLTGHPTITARETEIYVPSMLTHGRKVLVAGLGEEDKWLYDESRQTLFIVTGNSSSGRKHRITVSLDPPLRPSFHVNSFREDFGGRIAGFFVLLVGMVLVWIRYFTQRW